MLIRLLGPVDVLADDGPREVRGLRRKAVLAALALHGGEVVSAGRLAEVVWGQDAPPTAVNTLQTHVSYLRTVLGSKNAIRACRPGYLLDLGGDSSDVRVAERLLREGTGSADPAQGVRHLRAALALWHGQSLADVTGVAWLEEQAVRLDLLCLQVWRRWSRKTRWMSRCTGSSCWRCTGAAARPMRWRCSAGCGPCWRSSLA
jgi:DNA-binding SARP family transcriptional activator